MSFIGQRQQGGSYADRAGRFLGQAAQTFAQQDRVIKPGEEEKTAGGALMSAGSMAGAGASFGPWGALAGAVVGLGGYLLS